jgi:hypothetical protein
MKYGSNKKMKDKMNPKRMPKSYGGDARTGYKKGSKVEMPKCMPN